MRAFMPFLWAWQNMHIVPHHLLSGEADINTSAFNTQPIGTGPYLLQFANGRQPHGLRGQPELSPRPRPVSVSSSTNSYPSQLVAYGQARTGEIDYFAVRACRSIAGSRQGAARPQLLPDAAALCPVHLFQLRQAAIQRPEGSQGALYCARDAEVDRRRLFRHLQPHALLSSSDALGIQQRAEGSTRQPATRCKMLDEAGWRVGADGIREKDGIKLKFTMSTTAGNPARQATPGSFPAELEADRRRDGDQEHAGLGGLGRVPDQDRNSTRCSSPGSRRSAWIPDYTARCHSGMIPARTGAGSTTRNTRTARSMRCSNRASSRPI